MGTVTRLHQTGMKEAIMKNMKTATVEIVAMEEPKDIKVGKDTVSMQALTVKVHGTIQVNAYGANVDALKRLDVVPGNHLAAIFGKTPALRVR